MFDGNVSSKPSRCHNLLLVLLRICFLPLGSGGMTDHVTFRWRSWNVFVHFVVYFGLALALFASQTVYPLINNFSIYSATSSFVELVTGYSSSIIMVAVAFPLVITAGMDGFPKKIVLNTNSSAPTGTWKNVLAGSFLFIGGSIWGISFFSLIETSRRNQLILITIHMVTWSYYSLLWTLPVAVVGVWINNLKAATREEETCPVKQTKFCLASYRKLSKSLGTFFFLYFGVIQILFVTWTFLGLTRLLSGSSNQKTEYLIVLGVSVTFRELRYYRIHFKT